MTTPPPPPLVDRALKHDGALFIRTDPSSYQDASLVSYEIGLQQPRAHVRFANVFVYGDETWLYVKHDPARIDALYAEHGHRLMPSEVSSKHWSKLRVEAQQDSLAEELLETSHALVHASLTKQGRELLSSLSPYENLFPDFHRLAVGYLAKSRVSLNYSDLPETPQLLVDGVPVARFASNALHLRSRKGDGWDVLGPADIGRWEAKLAEAVRRQLAVQRPG